MYTLIKSEITFGIGYFTIQAAHTLATTDLGITKQGKVIQNMWNLDDKAIKSVLLQFNKEEV